VRRNRNGILFCGMKQKKNEAPQFLVKPWEQISGASNILKRTPCRCGFLVRDGVNNFSQYNKNLVPERSFLLDQSRIYEANGVFTMWSEL
jgi:hypothetical protein